MTLFLEQSEYLSIYGREAGIRVSINPPDTVALPSDEGITVRPGTVTSIGLRYVRFDMNYVKRNLNFCLAAFLLIL